MPATAVSYAGLNFIRTGWCPLEFHCVKLGEHPSFRDAVRNDPALAELEIGESLRYPTQFPYNDHNRHRRTGTQIVTAPFGLSPVDFDMFLGIFTYLWNLDELPQDLQVKLSIDFIGKLAGLPRTCPQDYARIQSRVFRFSYVKLTNSAAWNSVTKSYESLNNFEFFSIKSMSALTEPHQKVSLQLSPEFARILKESPAMAFDSQTYRAISAPALRRFFLHANRDAWNQRDSMIYDADAFATHQLGYARDADPQKDRLRRKDRLHKLRKRIKEAEQRDWIRPYHAWNGYFCTPRTGPLRGRVALRWSRGPALRTKETASKSKRQCLDHDALYNELKRLGDQQGKPLAASRYRSLLSEYGRARLQKHADVVLAQRELNPGSFNNSEIAAFVDRVQQDYAAPDWYTDFQRSKDRVDFTNIEPGHLARNLYQTISRNL